jgi:uncharacterized protein
MSLRLIRAHALSPQPWKNGGGITTEIAIGPDGATVHDFDWRISMARVAADGPFSSFPGIDRTLTVLEGDGLLLRVGGAAPVLLDAASAPFVFSGDSATSATLRRGPITDLNVMTRRGRIAHTVERIDLAAAETRSIASGLRADSVTVFYVVRGAIGVARAEPDNARLSPGDSVVIDGSHEITVSANAPAHALLVRLGPT